MALEAMARLGGRPKRRFEAKARALAGDSHAVQFALEHTLLWREWKALLKQQTKTEGEADICAIHRRMVELDEEMREALKLFEVAAAKQERTGTNG